MRLRRGSIAWLGAALLGGVIIAAAPAVADVVSTWTAGPGAIGDDTYAGFIDSPSAGATVPPGSFVVTGWFVDKAAEGWAGADDVQIFQGTMDGGGRMLARAVIAQNRPDVAAVLGNPYWAASGFTAFIPPASLSPGPQTLSVYVHTPGKGWWSVQVAVNVGSGAAAAPAPSGVPAASGPIVGFERPKPDEIVPTRNDFEVIGYALDPRAGPSHGVAGSGIDRVQVFLSNNRDNGGVLLGDAELGFSDSTPIAQYGGQFALSGWRLTFKPTTFHANTYVLIAHARSAVSGQEDVAQRFFTIHE